MNLVIMFLYLYAIVESLPPPQPPGGKRGNLGIVMIERIQSLDKFVTLVKLPAWGEGGYPPSPHSQGFGEGGGGIDCKVKRK